MTYYWIRQLHIATVVFNICFFSLRFYWMLNRPALAQTPWVRRLSQFNDTLLLAAGIAMAVMSRQYPFEAPWLTTKLLVLILYILLGTMALRLGKTPPPAHRIRPAGTPERWLYRQRGNQSHPLPPGRFWYIDPINISHLPFSRCRRDKKYYFYSPNNCILAETDLSQATGEHVPLNYYLM